MKKGEKKNSIKKSSKSSATKNLDIKVSENSKKRPLGVKIIAIAEYVISFLFLSTAILIIDPETYASIINELPPAFQQIPPQMAWVYFFILSIVVFILALNLWKMKNWSRIAHLIIYGLLIISDILALIKGVWISIIELIIEIIVKGVVIWYLSFNKKIISKFRNGW